MFPEDTTSRELPSPTPRPLPVPLGHLARRVASDGRSTALPTYDSEHSRLVHQGVIADGRHAARLLFTFDTSTHGAWQTVAPSLRPQLKEALEDLRATPDEAMDEGYPQPTQLALANAGRVLRLMHTLLPTRLEVYPTPDGEVALVAPGGPRCSVMVLCESNGGALCMVNMDGEHRRARYSTADGLPDGFLRDALNELAHRAG